MSVGRIRRNSWHLDTMKKISSVVSLAALFAGAVFTAVFTAGIGRAQNPPSRPPDPAREKRLEWVRDAKYGLFIHWGLYALPAGQWNGKRSPGLGEWVMFRSRVPVKEYEQLAARFNPVRYNADEWVKLAKDAGMKYIV